MKQIFRFKDFDETFAECLDYMQFAEEEMSYSSEPIASPYRQDVVAVKRCKTKEEQWDKLITTGLFHDACGKVIEVDEAHREVIVEQDY